MTGSRRVRALGSRHSFNEVAATDGTLVSLHRMPTVVDVDSERQVVRVSGATRFGELGTDLARQGLALANTGSLPHISVAGTVATGTHGSGRTNRVLAAGVRALHLMGADGEVSLVSRDTVGDAFDGSVLALGRLGIVTELEVDVEPTFDIAQTVVIDVPDDAVGARLEEMLSCAYSVSVFTRFEPGRNRVWAKHRVQPGDVADEHGVVVAPGLADDLWGGRISDVEQHPVEGVDTAAASPQLGVPGPWNERLPHFRLEFTPSVGDELQTEYLLPISAAPQVWAGLMALRERLAPLALTCELRAIAADPLWLSPTQGVDALAVHFTWHPRMAEVTPVLESLEALLLPLGARPHWAKVFALPAEQVGALYPRLADFRALVAERDPEGRFGTDLVDRWLGLPSSAPAGGVGSPLVDSAQPPRR
ncbi:alditol oxidase [Angustibacter aerolatus]